MSYFKQLHENNMSAHNKRICTPLNLEIYSQEIGFHDMESINAREQQMKGMQAQQGGGGGGGGSG